MSRSDFDSNNDSDTDSGRPSDHDIQKTLCNTVAKLFKAGDLDILTLKRVRSDAASKLDLTEDFFKTDAKWKDKSKEIVHGEVVRLYTNSIRFRDCVTETRCLHRLVWKLPVPSNLRILRLPFRHLHP